MKKNLILSLCMLLGVTACQKENKTSIGTTGKAKLSSTFVHNVSMPPAYTDLTLMSDGSYEAWWNGCGIRVTGNPAWDMQKYPTLVNGVPVTAMDFSTYDETSSIVSYNTGLSGNVFRVEPQFLSLPSFKSTGFTTDLDKYLQAVYAAADNPNNVPLPEIVNYIKDTYTYIPNSGPQIKVFTGKLIRVTTGSNLAIADMSYPLPAASTVPTVEISLGINDLERPADHFPYRIYSKANIITKAIHNGVTLKATGSCIPTPGTGIFHLIGTVTRSDGSEYKFDIIQDFS